MKTKLNTLTVLRCALADLEGSKQARDQQDIEVHDWKAHSLTISEVKELIEQLEA